MHLLPVMSKLFTTEVLLVLYSALGLHRCVFCPSKLPKQENLWGAKIPFANLHTDYDWDKILQAAVPTFIIAFGAGFTIPFINLFSLKMFMVWTLVIFRS